ncbi:MAG: hypothetical protein GY714_12325 [Desulfobacterales bacterium]|nr:hypothetical protein [Desulfobacterales bacterium]MCP4158747.1 hypothetical protein [Deltaproteobacteria bacterium]
MTLINVKNFYMAVSMSDLVSWSVVDEEECIENPELRSVIELLGIELSLTELYNTFFDEAVGTGDVFLFQPDTNSSNLFAIDLYHGMSDQMNIVNLGISCEEKLLFSVRTGLRAFFESASCQVRYEEASYSVSLHQMLDARNYPKSIKESGYKQNLVLKHG